MKYSSHQTDGGHMSLLQRITARAFEGCNTEPDCVPEWEGAAIVVFGLLIVIIACLLGPDAAVTI